ncbi:MAG: DUF4276 family protein [Methylococcales bacterium]|nr:DUF4276 family protein [Methylococcales bacterium]
MYVVIAEDASDVKCLKVLIKRLAGDKPLTIEGKGFGSCGNMLNKGARFLNTYSNQAKFSKFIICHDRDKSSYQSVYKNVDDRIIKNAGINNKEICILIPTEEIEAWILADIKAVKNVISSWPHNKIDGSPEDIKNPKEVLQSLSRIDKPRPLYNHVLHNEKIMGYLDLAVVKNKCPSFAELAAFVESGKANYPNR